MKRIFLMLLCAAVLVPIWAHDIIVTNSQERIDCNVIRVQDDEVIYKKLESVTAISYMDVSKIASIIYEDGTVRTFEKKAKSMMIDKIDGYYVLGKERMSESMYLEFIKNNCQEAWESYRKGQKLIGGGCVLLIVGGAIFGTGIGLAAAGNFGIYTVKYNPQTGQVYNTTLTQKQLNFFYAGAALMSVGSVAMAGSIPLLVVGSIKKNNSHEVYNESCAAKQAQLSLNLQTSSEGIGLALRF